MIYFDNAATTYPKPKEVYDFMDQFYREYGFNAGRSSYKAGTVVLEMIEETRTFLGKLIGMRNVNQILFFSSATLALNQVLQGTYWNQGDVVYFSPFEHNGTLRVLYYLQNKYNISLKPIPVDPQTLNFQLDQLEHDFILYPPRITIVSHVSNVCGVITPVKKIAELVKRFNGEIVVDAAQCGGLLPAPMDLIDYYIIAGHKSLYGPFGIAGLVINVENPNLHPFIYGGTGSQSEMKEMPAQLPSRYEAGSMNIQAIAGLNAALRWIEKVTPEKIVEHDKKLLAILIETLQSFMDIRLYLPAERENHFAVVSAQFAGYTPQEIGKILDERFDIAVRTGLHCSPKAHELLGTLPLGTVRFSLGYFNTEEDVFRLKECLEQFIF